LKIWKVTIDQGGRFRLSSDDDDLDTEADQMPRRKAGTPAKRKAGDGAEKPKPRPRQKKELAMPAKYVPMRYTKRCREDDGGAAAAASCDGWSSMMLYTKRRLAA
jgi:hypothetical protein